MKPDIDYKKFGKTIKTLRLGKKITQQTICDAIDISNTHYSNIENGLAKPSLEVLVSLSNYYNVFLSASLGSESINYKIPYNIKNIFNNGSDPMVLRVLDIVTYAQSQIYPEKR